SLLQARFVRRRGDGDNQGGVVQFLVRRCLIRARSTMKCRTTRNWLGIGIVYFVAHCGAWAQELTPPSSNIVIAWEKAGGIYGWTTAGIDGESRFQPERPAVHAPPT